MKVTKKQDGYHSKLTSGKSYDVISTDLRNGWYEITDDSGKTGKYSVDRFSVVPVMPVAPVEVECVDATDTYGWLKVGQVYQVEKETSTHCYIGTGDDTACYSKRRFIPAASQPTYTATDSPEKNAAYQRIVKVEKYETTDGEVFTIEKEAMQHQLILDAAKTFQGIFGTPLQAMVKWAKAYPDSFATLIRLVKEES